MVKVASPKKVVLRTKNAEQTSNEVVAYLTTHPVALAAVARRHVGVDWFVIVAKDASVYVCLEKSTFIVVGTTEKNSQGVEILLIDNDKFSAILLKLVSKDANTEWKAPVLEAQETQGIKRMKYVNT